MKITVYNLDIHYHRSPSDAALPQDCIHRGWSTSYFHKNSRTEVMRLKMMDRVDRTTRLTAG